MSIEAPLSSYKKKNLIIYTVILAGVGGWFWYDGHYNQKFIDKHTINGKADGTLEFNRKAPAYMLAAAALFAVRFFMVKDKKIVAGDNGLVYEKLTIPYDRIDSIDKTHFDKKSYFIVHYRDPQDKVGQVQINGYQYDNVPAVLDHLVSKLTS
jgi:hypothetical protein